MMKSDAIVFRGPGRVSVEEVDIPEVGPGDVLVDIEYSSVSTGTERWCLNGKIQMGIDRLIQFPFVTGYQAAGTVREVGPEVREIRPGDRVFSPRARLGQEWEGSWAGHVGTHVADEGSVIRLPESVSTRTASGLVLAQVGFNGATRPAVGRGDIAIVIGDGLVGQYAAQVLGHRGARVIMSGHHEHRLEIAKRFGADEVVNSSEVDFFKYVGERYPGGVQVAVETASKRELVRRATHALQYAGQLVVLGYYPEGECLIDIHWTRLRETTVYFPNGFTQARLRETLSLIDRGVMEVDGLITHEFPHREAPGAYRMLDEKSTDFLGIVIRWD
jgi:2-desacetyl-2-hydroxyethyl bacteriochlorophyllide A dehydrogenase